MIPCSKFCGFPVPCVWNHYSLKSINFFLARIQVSFICIYLSAFATIVQQSKGLFYDFVFLNISRKQSDSYQILHPGFWICIGDWYKKIAQNEYYFWSYFFKSYLERNFWSIDNLSFFRQWTIVWLILAFWIQRNRKKKNLIDKD